MGCWRDGWLRGPSCLLGRSRPRRLGGGAQVVAPQAPVAQRLPAETVRLNNVLAVVTEDYATVLVG